jgi:hypothetical protein
MSKLFRIIFLGLTIITFLGVLAELPIRQGYLKYKLADTQYEKLLWLICQFQNGKLKDKHFDIAFFGTSSTMYGINDSVTTSKSINLGLNTGSREIELFILEKFLENGNTSKHWIKEFHSLQYSLFDYYGLHPVLHYVTTPSWLIKNGQSILQPHFVIFFLNRIRAVVQSWIFFHNNSDYNSSYTQYGYRPKNKVLSHETYYKVINSKSSESSNTKINDAIIYNWRHNFSAVKLFRKKFEQKIFNFKKQKVKYLYLPTLIAGVENEIQLQKEVNKMGNHYNITIIPFLVDPGFYKTNLNWADMGHYSNKGSIFFTQLSEKVIVNF